MADVCATPGLSQAMEIEEIEERKPTGSNPLSASLLNEDALIAAKEKIESDDFKSKIHRFPPNLRGFGRDRDYIEPWIVAIGPYYHGVPELQAMKEVKRMAAYYFCEGLADSADEVNKKVLPVACDARSCYADADALKGISDDDFAAMMFFDGCFLVQFMVSAYSAKRSHMSEVIATKGRANMLRDITLLENQIPWPVIQLLTALRPAPMGDFIGRIMSFFNVRRRLASDEVNIDKDFKPPHLLGLIHFYLVRSSFVEKESRRALLDELLKKTGAKELTLTTSAAELAEIGVKLTSSGTTQFSEMKFVSGLVRGMLSLAPLLLGELNGCRLVNMAAFEQCTGTPGEGNYCVNSYLSVLALLMNRDDDVRELRGKGVVHTSFNYHQTLNFFESLAPQLAVDDSYYVILQGLEVYKQRRWVCIAIHKFLYNNRKTIAAVLSIVGVLVGIFKTLLSIKQHQP